jgi:hypothetical protein
MLIRIRIAVAVGVGVGVVVLVEVGAVELGLLPVVTVVETVDVVSGAE